MPFVEGFVLVGEDSHGADSAIVGNQWNAAKTSLHADRIGVQFANLIEEILANQNRLAGADDVFRQKVTGRSASARRTDTVDNFQFELHFVANRVQGGDVEIFHVEQAAQLFPDFAQKIFFVEGGTQCAADFIQDMQFLGAAGSLLDQKAIFHGHADLMAKGQQQA